MTRKLTNNVKSEHLSSALLDLVSVSWDVVNFTSQVSSVAVLVHSLIVSACFVVYRVGLSARGSKECSFTVVLTSSSHELGCSCQLAGLPLHGAQCLLQ